MYYGSGTAGRCCIWAGQMLNVLSRSPGGSTFLCHPQQDAQVGLAIWDQFRTAYMYMIIGDRAFPVDAARVWNSLPVSVTSAATLNTFKQRLKTEPPPFLPFPHLYFFFPSPLLPFPSLEVGPFKIPDPLVVFNHWIQLVGLREQYEHTYKCTCTLRCPHAVSLSLPATRCGEQCKLTHRVWGDISASEFWCFLNIIVKLEWCQLTFSEINRTTGTANADLLKQDILHFRTLLLVFVSKQAYYFLAIVCVTPLEALRSSMALDHWTASLSSTSSYSEILQSTTTLSAGDKDQLSIQGIQYHGTSCLELSVSSYKKVPLPSPLSRHMWNWTVRSCIRHGLTFLLPLAPLIRTIWHMAPPINVFDIDIAWTPMPLFTADGSRAC